MFYVRHPSDTSKPGYWEEFTTLERAVSEARANAEILGGEWEVVQKIEDDFEVVATERSSR